MIISFGLELRSAPTFLSRSKAHFLITPQAGIFFGLVPPHLSTLDIPYAGVSSDYTVMPYLPKYQRILRY